MYYHPGLIVVIYVVRRPLSQGESGPGSLRGEQREPRMGKNSEVTISSLRGDKVAAVNLEIEVFRSAGGLKLWWTGVLSSPDWHENYGECGG